MFKVERLADLDRADQRLADTVTIGRVNSPYHLGERGGSRTRWKIEDAEKTTGTMKLSRLDIQFPGDRGCSPCRS